MTYAIPIVGLSYKEFKEAVSARLGALPSQWLTATASYTIPSLAAGAIAATQTVSVTGAAMGNPASIAFSLNTQGLIGNAWVSAANTVSYAFYNPTSGTLNIGAGTVTVAVWQP